MALQVVNITNSNVEFVDKGKDPVSSIEKTNADLLFDLLEKEIRIADLEKNQANLTFELIAGGIL
ncbi:hypothetical protein [Acinetobacter baumannii]